MILLAKLDQALRLLKLPKHQGAVTLLDGIRNSYPARVTVGSGFFVSVLELLQFLSVSLSEPHGSRLYVDVADVACAMREADYGVERSRAYDVTGLEAGVIVAVPKGR